MNFFSPSHAILSLVIGCAVFCTTSCEKKKESINADELFQETEKALNSSYIFLDDHRDEIFSSMYSASIKKLNSDDDKSGNTRTALVAALNTYDGTEQRLKIYEVLKSSLAALPEGQNTFIPPESLFWSRDPERDAGIGLVIRQDGPGKFMAIDTLEGSASHRENMELGKYIIAVDDIKVSGMDLEELVGRIKGPADSSVKLTFSDRSYKLVRGKVSFQNIINSTWDLSGKNKAEYIILRSTLPGSKDQLKALIENLDKPSAIILDIRKLQPGDFAESFNIADLFLTSGRMGTIKTKNETDIVFEADPEISYRGKIYLLVGSNQSPYADVIALALKRSDMVKIIGTDISGKNSFITKMIPTASGIELRITSGYILDSDNFPFYKSEIKADYRVRDILPPHAPLKEADSGDPAQMKAQELLTET